MVSKIKSVSIAVLLLLIIPFIFSLNSCKVYSFTGANVPTNIKSVQVDLFQNRANNGPPTLSQTFTDRLKTKFATEGNLKQVSTEGDLVFRGYISGYVITSQAATVNSPNSVNRLTITVYVDYKNKYNEKDVWAEQDRSFSRYAEFPSTETLTNVEDRLISEINTQLVEDIFTKALVKW